MPCVFSCYNARCVCLVLILSRETKLMLYDANRSCLISGHRYRKSVEELQKNSDKKVALLTNATKKAEAIVCIIFIILSAGKKW